MMGQLYLGSSPVSRRQTFSVNTFHIAVLRAQPGERLIIRGEHMVRCLVFNPAKPMNEISVEDVSDFGQFISDHNPGNFCIGCATRYFNGVAHDVWHDDEFLYNGGGISGIISTVCLIRDGKGTLRRAFTCTYYPEEESE